MGICVWDKSAQSRAHPTHIVLQVSVTPVWLVSAKRLFKRVTPAADVQVDICVETNVAIKVAQEQGVASNSMSAKAKSVYHPNHVPKTEILVQMAWDVQVENV